MAPTERNREWHSEEKVMKTNEVTSVRGKWYESRARFECWEKEKGGKQSDEEQITLFQVLGTVIQLSFTL